MAQGKTTELELLLKELPDKRRARMLKGMGISLRTLQRWFEEGNITARITITMAPVIKRELDEHYQADHNIHELCKPVRITGRKATAA